MQRARHQLLAGAALADDQDAGVGDRGAGDLAPQLLDRRRGAEDLGLAAQVGLERGHLALEGLVLQGVVDRLQEALAAERLLDEVVDAEPQRLDRLADRGLARDDDGGGEALRRHQPPHQVDAAHGAQADVEQQQLGER